jgi:hypothetical protein
MCYFYGKKINTERTEIKHRETRSFRATHAVNFVRLGDARVSQSYSKEGTKGLKG